ncbi:unnamed protein product [Calypogeia fissa]
MDRPRKSGKRKRKGEGAPADGQPEAYWVSSANGEPIRVSTAGCKFVAHFIKTIATDSDCTTALGLGECRFNFTLSLTEYGEALRRDLPIADIPKQPGYEENSCDTHCFWHHCFLGRFRRYQHHQTP